MKIERLAIGDCLNDPKFLKPFLQDASRCYKNLTKNFYKKNQSTPKKEKIINKKILTSLLLAKIRKDVEASFTPNYFPTIPATFRSSGELAILRKLIIFQLSKIFCKRSSLVRDKEVYKNLVIK
jgi:hypothetical protein